MDFSDFDFLLTDTCKKTDQGIKQTEQHQGSWLLH